MQILHIHRVYMYDLRMNEWGDWNKLTKAVRYMGGTATTSEIEKAGFSRNSLYAARDDGRFLELSRGVFRLADAPPVSHLDFVAVCKRAPQGTICLESALARWDLIDDIPTQVHLAVRQGSTRPTISWPATKVHVFSVRSFEIERRREDLSTGESYSIYGPQRSVIDALRMRRRYGGGPGLEALRNYLLRPNANRRKLLELARELNVEAALLQALEILG